MGQVSGTIDSGACAKIMRCTEAICEYEILENCLLWARAHGLMPSAQGSGPEDISLLRVETAPRHKICPRHCPGLRGE